MRDELGRRFVEHARLGTGLEIFVHEAPDAAVAIDLIQAILLDDLAEVAAVLDPVAFLDDAAIHVHEVEAAVRAVHHVHDTEVRIAGADELRLGVGIADAGDAVFVRHLGATDESADGLGDEDVATEVGWQAVAAHDFLAARGGEVIQGLVETRTTGAALVVGQTDLGPDLHEVLGELRLDVVGSVKNRGLEMPQAFFATGVRPPDLALVVLSEAPLAAAVRDGFLEGFLGAVPAQAVRVIRLVHPVIHRPDQAALLVLEVAVLGTAHEPRLLGVGDAVAIGVAVDEDIKGVGLVDEHAVVERQDHARQDHLVAEEDVLVELAIALGALVTRDDADRVVLILSVDVLHVRAQLGDVHATVAIEGQVRRLAQAVALAEHELETITFGELDGLQFFFRRQRLDGRLRGEIGLIGLLVGGVGSHEGERRQIDGGSHGGMTLKSPDCSVLSSRIPCPP